MSTQTGTRNDQTPAGGLSRRRRWVLAACAAAAVVAVVVAVGATVSLGNITIISGWFPTFLFWLTIAVFAIAVVLRRDVLHEFKIGVPVGALIAAVLFAALALTQAVPPGTPRSLYWWLAVACLMTGLVVAGWHRAHWPRRISGIAAIILAVLSAGSAMNQTFAYYPTFDRLFGKDANNFMDNEQLEAMRHQVDKTGKLPPHGATLSIAIPAAPNEKYAPRPAYVWVPPAWFARNHPQLPVIELLHGTPGQPSDWTRASNADGTSLAFAEQHGGVAPILVMPDINGSLTGDSECINTAQYGDVATYLTKTVPQFMRKNFNASTKTGSMAIAGLSEGGTCAMTLALTNPTAFPVFANYSGLQSPSTYDASQTVPTLFGGSQASYEAHNPPYLMAHQRFSGMSAWFEAGLQDPYDGLASARALLPLAVNAGIDSCLATPPGTHNFAFWQQAYADSLPWMSWKLHLTPQPQSVPAQCTPGKS